MLEAKQPEYMSWDLEKLQQEYFSVRLRLTQKELQLAEAHDREKKVDRFIDALNDLLEENEDE